MSDVRCVLMVVLTAAVTVGLAGAPASAQTKVRRDKVGDAPAFVDIRSAKVQNNSRNLAVTVRFQKVRQGRTAVGFFLLPGTSGEVGTSGHFYAVDSVPASDTEWESRLYRYSADPDDAADASGEEMVSCPGLSARWKRGTRGFARVVVPQSCLGADAGTFAARVLALDVRDSPLRSLPAALRGDESGGTSDVIPSAISTRRR